MDRSAFNRMSSLLQTREAVISEARYDARAFGSWFIVVDTRPPLRVVWDGKDGWLYVQRRADEIHTGNQVWENLRILKNPPDYDEAITLVADEIRLARGSA